jgi:hypothetical protein
VRSSRRLKHPDFHAPLCSVSGTATRCPWGPAAGSASSKSTQRRNTIALRPSKPSFEGKNKVTLPIRGGVARRRRKCARQVSTGFSPTRHIMAWSSMASFFALFTREKRYLTCVNFPFLSSPNIMYHPRRYNPPLADPRPNPFPFELLLQCPYFRRQYKTFGIRGSSVFSSIPGAAYLRSST